MSNVQFYDPQKALDYLLKSLEADPSDATTWYHLGRVHRLEQTILPHMMLSNKLLIEIQETLSFGAQSVFYITKFLNTETP